MKKKILLSRHRVNPASAPSCWLLLLAAAAAATTTTSTATATATITTTTVVSQEGASPTGLILALVLVQWAKLSPG